AVSAISAIALRRDAPDQRWAAGMAIDTSCSRAWRMIRKSAQRFSKKIMRKQQAILVTRPAAKCSRQKQKRGPKRPRWVAVRIIRSAGPARSAAGAATAARATLRTGTGAEYRLRFHRQQALTLQLLAGEFARTAHGFRLFAGFLLGGLFIVAAELHLAEDAL